MRDFISNLTTWGRLAAMAIYIAATSGPAFAGVPELPKLKPGAYASVWIIDPAPIGSSSRILKERERFLEAPLLPLKLYSVQSGPITVQGSTIELPGQLVGLYSDKTVACANDPAQGKVVHALAGKGGKSRLCLVDSDGDKAFDHAFLAEGLGNNGLNRFVREAIGMGIVQVQGFLPDTMPTITPIPYGEVDRITFADKRFLHLYYYNHAEIGRAFSMGFLINRQEDFVLRADTIRTHSWDDKAIPIDLKMFGIPLRIESMVEGHITLVAPPSSGPYLAFFGTRPNL